MHFGGSQTPRVLHPVPSFSINTDEMNGVWVTQTPHHQTRASASLRVRCFWDENGQDISCNIPHHFLHYLLIELIFADKSEIGTKYGMPNLKTGWKRFRCYPDRFLLFQFYSGYPVFEIRYIPFFFAPLEVQLNYDKAQS